MTEPCAATSESRERAPTTPEHPGLVGIFGRPYLDLEPHLDLSALAAVHDEICAALAQLPVGYTGGSHRSMGIMPPSRRTEGHIDYGEVIRSLAGNDLEAFLELGDTEAIVQRGRLDADGDLTYGEEHGRLLSHRQMLWLKVRYGVYFPWKAYLELMPNRYWREKASPEGKRFTRVAEAFFPKTIAFVRSLPFVHVGRCNLMGLEAFDHGTVHRDGDPAEQSQPDHFISFDPGGHKQVFLWDERAGREIPIRSRAYWFNDFDYHGVSVAPRFRYSVRVDGVFQPAFLAQLRAGERSLA